ncbi:MAG: HlyD family efflux transporter periplasmic adaptor subunit [Cyanobacteriota bacterium]
MSPTKSSNALNYSPLNSEGLRPVQPDEFLPPVDRWATVGGIAMLVIFSSAVALAAVLKYPATVKAAAIVRPTGELRIVQAAATGKVIRIEAKANQTMKQGEAIAFLDDSQLQTQKRQLQSSIQQTQRQLEQINAQIQAVQSQAEAEEQAVERAIAAATGELQLNQRQHQERLVTTQAEVREAQAAAKLAREELGRYQKLANTGAVAQSQISEKAATLEAALARLQQAQAALNPSPVSMKIAAERVAQERAKGASTLATLNREREALIQQTSRLQNELTRDRQDLQQLETELANTVIRAPVTGTIQQLNLRNIEQLVRPGDAIAQIAPSNVPLVVKAFVTPQDIGQVEVGQTVKMKVSGCPYPDYGTLAGTLTAISPDATEQQSQTITSSSQDLPRPTLDNRYEVTIQPQTFFLGASSHPCYLQAGMNGNADIITRQETVLTFFLRKARLQMRV